jgi:hypothetical protein
MKALNGPHPWWHRRFSSGVNKLKKLSFDLLSGAWFHKKNIGDTEVIDETPDVDASRTWHKARALQFTDGTDYVSISKTYPSTDTPTSFEVTLEIITGNSIVSNQDIFCTDDAGQAAGVQLRIENYTSEWRFGLRVGNVVSRDTSFAVQTNTRYILVISYSDNTATLTVNGATNLTITPTSDIAGAGLIMLGRRYTSLGNYFNGILGYVKVKEDNIVIGEYAFEEGEGTVCYNRVMNNFHGTINNATISTFRVEDVRITNGDQGTFLNTDGYSYLNVYTSDFSSGSENLSELNGTSADGVSILGVDDAYRFTLSEGNKSHIAEKSNLYEYGKSYTVSFDYYIPSGQTVTGILGPIQEGNTGSTVFNTTGSWQSVSVNIDVREQSAGNSNDIKMRFYAHNGTNFTVNGDDDVFYLKNIVITQTNLYVPRPRVTDIPLYNAGKYAYYIPDDANNFIDLNTAFAGLTNPGDWMEFGIATVGTGEPDISASYWSTYTSGNSQFFANIASGVDFRIFGPNGGQNQMRTVVASIDVPNNDFYSLKVTKTVEAPADTSGTVGQLDLFDRNGNLIVSHNLSAGSLGNEGTYTFDRFFPTAYSTDFILAYLKLSDGTVWNGANDFNGGVNITNTGTGNVTKIFFESVDEDVLGNPLTYKGQVAQPLSLVNSNGGLFSSGVKAYWDTSRVFNLDDFTMVWYAYLDENLRAPSDYRETFAGINISYLFYFRTAGIYFRANNINSVNKPFLEGNIPDADFINKWQRFSFTRSASNNIATFTAGDVVRTVNLSETSGLSFEFKSFGDLGQDGLQGQLAWASVHSKLLTPSQVAALDPYNMDTNGLEVFLVPSAGSGSIVYDLSANNRHGTIANATLSDFWIKQDQFHWNLKKGFDKVYNLDGVDDYIEPDSILSVTGDFFIEFGFLCDASGFYISSDGGDYIAVFGNYIKFRTAIGPTDVSFSGIETGQFYNVRIERNGDQLSATINGVYYPGGTINTGGWDIVTIGTNSSLTSFIRGFVSYLNLNNQYFGSGLNWPNATVHGNPDVLKIPISTQKDGSLSNPAGKWHNDAETEINFPHTATFEVLNRQFTTAPFFTKNAEKYTSDFSSTTDNFAAIVGASGSVAANIDGVTDDSATSFDNCLSYTAASGTNLQHGVLTDMDNILELRTNVDGSNQVFYAEVRFLLPSTNNQINGFRVWTGWGVHNSSNPFNFPQANISITSDAVGTWRKEMFGPFTLTDIGGSTISLRLQGLNGTDFTIDNDAFGDLIYIESVRVIQMPTLKDVTFADMYQSWYDYEYLHRLFAHFVVPNQVHNILAYTDELTADQKQQVYDYLQKNYHPIYTPYSTRVLADGGTLAAGQTNTLTIIDSI